MLSLLVLLLAIIAGFDKALIKEISQSYPGRASMAPSLDIFITLLSMGVRGYKQLLDTRKQLFTSLGAQLKMLEERYPVRVLKSKNNTISIAVSLDWFKDVTDKEGEGRKEMTSVGSMLFTRGVSGTRVVTGKDTFETDTSKSFNRKMEIF